MKIFSKIMALCVLVLGFSACAENDLLPDYELVGTATATLAGISVSNDEPLPGEEVTVTLSYVNRPDDPATQIELLEQVGDGDFTSEVTLDESSTQADQEVTRTYTYTVPDVAVGTDITLDMLLSSQNREFPQRERTSLEVSAPADE